MKTVAQKRVYPPFFFDSDELSVFEQARYR